MHSTGKSLFIGIICTLSLALLPSCQRTPQYHVKEEEITVTGTLSATGVSLIRRGTHVVVNDDETSWFVESKNIDLQPYEGHRVTIAGMQKNNTSPSFLPVIVAENIQSLDGISNKHEWRIPTLKVIIKTPDNWNGKMEKNTASFSLENFPINFLYMKLEQKKYQSDASFQNFTLHGHRGMRKMNDMDESQEIRLEHGSNLLSIIFKPLNVVAASDTVAHNAMIHDFEQMLNDMIFVEDASSVPATGTGTGIPCGGSAGVLCPAGYFCDISDLATRIGHCAK